MINRIAKVSLLVRLEVPVEIPSGTCSPYYYAEQHAIDHAMLALTDRSDLSLIEVRKGDSKIHFVEGDHKKFKNFCLSIDPLRQVSFYMPSNIKRRNTNNIPEPIHVPIP